MKKKIILIFPCLISLVSSAYAEDNSTIQTDNIVVTASGYNQNVKEAPASITVITKEEISQKGFTDLRDVLNDIEGVDVKGSSSRMGVANVSIRGMGPSYTLLMIDGVPLNGSTDSSVGPNGFGAEMSSFIPPIASIEKIEVIKGPMSTIYGSDAIGGVVNIITKPIADEDHGSFSVDHTFETEKGRGDTTRYSFNVSGPIEKDKLGIQLRGNYVRRLNSTDSSGKTYDGANITPSGANNYNIGTRLSWTPTKTDAYYIDLGNARVDYTDCGEKNPGFRFDRQRYIIGAKNKTSRGVFDSYLAYQKTSLHGWGSLSNNQDKYKTMEGTNIIFNTMYTTELDNHKLITGLKLWRESVDLDTLKSRGIEGNLSAFNKAIFIEDTWKFNKKLSFTYGTRLELPQNFASHLSPRGYLVYKADDKWTIKGGISTGFKSPSLTQTQNGIVSISDSSWGRGGGVVTYIHGNPNLKPETSINKEIGFYYGNESKRDFSGHVTLFHIDYNNKINEIELYSHHNQYMNTNKARSQGIELGTKFPIGKDIDMKINYTYNISKVIGGKYDGSSVFYTPRHSLNAKLNWYVDDKTDVWLGMEYKVGMVRYANSAAKQEVIDRLGKYYKPYAILNAGIQHRINDKVKVSFTINNLLDKDFNRSTNINGTDYNEFCNPGKGGTGSYIGRRSFWLGLSYEF